MNADDGESAAPTDYDGEPFSYPEDFDRDPLGSVASPVDLRERLKEQVRLCLPREQWQVARTSLIVSTGRLFQRSRFEVSAKLSVPGARPFRRIAIQPPGVARSVGECFHTDRVSG
jgi:hypothetical protein